MLAARLTIHHSETPEHGKALEPIMATIHTTAPDDPEGTIHELASSDVARAICRRFESRPVAVHPTEPDTFIYDPGNFWDGPTHVRYEPSSGHFTFSGWTGDEHFPMVGPLK
jgi:hypothetical protein